MDSQVISSIITGSSAVFAVEQQHCERNKSAGGESFKLRTRTAAREKTGLNFSGRFTAGNWKENE